MPDCGNIPPESFMRTCSVCKEAKPLSAYPPNKTSKFGRHTTCSKCKALYANTQAASNKRRNLERPPIIPATKRCPVCARVLPGSAFSKAVHQRDGLGANCKECRSAEKRTKRARTMAYARWDEKRTRDPIYYKLKIMIWSARKRAKAGKYPFSIDVEYLSSIVPKTCPVLGMPLNWTHTVGLDDSPTLDKFYPHLGYVPGNVHIVSFRANSLKSDANVLEISKVSAWMESVAAEKGGLREYDARTPSARTRKGKPGFLKIADEKVKNVAEI